MSKEIYITSTPHETRLAIVENEALTEIYYERENEYTLAGSIYNGRVTRVLPGMQSSFVDIGLERDAFLYITDFMEEAADPEEFDTTGGDQPRAPRTIEGSTAEATPRNQEGGRRDRGRDRDRGSREPQEQNARPSEPTDAELFEQAAAGLGVVRTNDGDRAGNRRGGRNRGRGGADGAPRRDQAETPRFEQSADAGFTPVAPEAPSTEGVGELGEGAPGADGSRRWRGRRGRRGNRGGREQAAAPLAGQPRTDFIPEVPESTSGVEPDQYEEDFAEPQFAEREGVDLQASAPLADARAVEARADQPRGREDRNRRGGREPRGNYGVESTTGPVYGAYPDADEIAPVTPIILPGESLSKYKPGGASEQAAAPAKPVAAAEFVLPAQWDGGLVLPGETIRPRGPAAESSRGGRGFEERPRRDRDDRGRAERSFVPSEPVTPVVAKAEIVAEPAEPVFLGQDLDRDLDQKSVEPVAFAPVVEELQEVALAPDDLSASHLVTPLHSTFIAPPPVPTPDVTAPIALEPIVPEATAIELVAEAAPAPAATAPLAAEAEYEPTDGAVSYRVDPVAPREFRQAAPTSEERAAEERAVDEPFAEAIAIAQEHQPIPETVAEPEPIAPEPTHSMAIDLGLPPVVDVPTTEVPGTFEHVFHAEPHEVTSISAAGEMHTEPVAEAQAQQTPEHENAVAESVAHETFSAPPPVHPGYFEPGQGLLEEEEIDEDDDAGDLHTIHADGQRRASVRLDADEQEALEHGADLGSMLREMSIDQITQTEPGLGEEDDDLDDDFEEDFLEEDLAGDDLAADDAEGEFEDEQEEAFADHEGEGELGEFGADDAEPGRSAESPATAQQPGGQREPRRDDGRGRREGRRGDRGRRSGGGGGDRPVSTGDRAASERSGGDRARREGHGGGHHGGRGGRQSMQSTNLPAISELLKPGQEILCQIAKEPIAKKGARITSHIALPGRFLVFMPTVNHTGVSRKIESDGERRRLKEILLSEKGEAAGGFIVRTAAAGASEEELRSDLRFLLNLWADIKQRSESSKSPALIYHDLNLVERVLRDQVTDNFSAIWVDNEVEYERVLRFLQRFQPSLIRRVKLYTKETPLFEQFGITEEINKALRSKVWLKSGGSIVINQTEALVAIDINTGKFVGKTARLEDTIVKTNLDAIPEIVRQIRLRDLGGIIIIDFIDMDERKNRNKVMAALEEELKTDRAPSKVLQFNDFGLVAITRKRVKQSLERTLSTTCSICAGTGMVKSPITVCNDIYIEMRKMAKHLDRGDVMLRVHPEVVKQLKLGGAKWLQEMEEMVGKTILIKSDPSLHPEQFDIH
jgi:ribonuclease G